MKILRCKPGHSIHIALKANVNPAMPADHLFARSGIDIFVGHMTEQEVKLALQVPQHFIVVHCKQFT